MTETEKLKVKENKCDQGEKHFSKFHYLDLN